MCSPWAPCGPHGSGSPGRLSDEMGGDIARSASKHQNMFLNISLIFMIRRLARASGRYDALARGTSRGLQPDAKRSDPTAVARRAISLSLHSSAQKPQWRRGPCMVHAASRTKDRARAAGIPPILEPLFERLHFNLRRRKRLAHRHGSPTAPMGELRRGLFKARARLGRLRHGAASALRQALFVKTSMDHGHSSAVLAEPWRAARRGFLGLA